MVRSRPSMIQHRRRGSATISKICTHILVLLMLPSAYGAALVLVFEWKRPWITFVISPDTTKLNLDDGTLSLPNPPRNKLYLPYCMGCTNYYDWSSKTSSTPIIPSQPIPPPLDTELKEENNLTDQCSAENTFLPIEGDRFEVDLSPQHITIDEELLLALIIISTGTTLHKHNSRVDENAPSSYNNLYNQQVFLLSILLLCVATIMAIISDLNGEKGEGVSNDNITAMKRNLSKQFNNLEVDTDLDSNDNATKENEEEEEDTPRAVEPPSNPLEHVLLKVLNIGNDNNKKDSKKKVLDKKKVNIKKEKDKMKKDIKKIKRRSTIVSYDSTADYPLKENQSLATREEDKRQTAGRRRPTLVKQTSQKVYGKGEKLLQVV